MASCGNYLENAFSRLPREIPCRGNIAGVHSTANHFSPLSPTLHSRISLYLIRFYDTVEIFLLDDVATFANEISVASLLLRFHRVESMGFKILWSFQEFREHDPDRCRRYNPPSLLFAVASSSLNEATSLN